LVELADVVVFVLDPRRDQVGANRRALDELRPWLDRGGRPPVDLIFQLNRRDLPGILDAGELRRELGLDGDLHETTARLGDALRLCSVAAVRAGVRRAALLLEREQLPLGPPRIATGAQLVEQLQRGADPVAATRTIEVVLPSRPPAAPPPPPPPPPPAPAP